MSIIVETCPECGYDLTEEVITTYPPIPKKVCFHCGWSWTGQPNSIEKVPFVDPSSIMIGEDKKSRITKLIGSEYYPVHIGDTVSGLCGNCLTTFVCITPKFYRENNFGYCKQCGYKIDF